MDYFPGLDVSVKETSICIVDDTVNGRLEKRHYYLAQRSDA